MKFSLAILAPLAALTQICTANFDIYRTQDSALVGGGVTSDWAISAAEPSESEVRNQRTWYSNGDVSGNKVGINCVGSCKFEDSVSGITRFEMHFSNNPLFHWTLYKDRGHPYKMYGRDGKVYGECIVFEGHSYRYVTAGVLAGRRKFRCLTQFTAAQISASW